MLESAKATEALRIGYSNYCELAQALPGMVLQFEGWECDQFHPDEPVTAFYLSYTEDYPGQLTDKIMRCTEETWNLQYARTIDSLGRCAQLVSGAPG